MIESTQGVVPPFAPAAPIGSDKVAVYALQDVYKEVPQKDGQDPKKVLVHARGHRQELEASIAREVIRNSPKDYGMVPPDGAAVAATGTIDPDNPAASPNAKVAAILSDPDALALLRSAILGPAPVPPVGLVTDLGAPGGLAATQAATSNTADGTTFQLTGLPGVDDKTARALEDSQLGTLDALRSVDDAKLAGIVGGSKQAKIIKAHIAEKFPTPKEG
jgi:hypothetical protein